MASSTTEKQLTVEELQVLLEQQKREIEEKDAKLAKKDAELAETKAVLAQKTNKPKRNDSNENSLTDLIIEKLKDAAVPDVHFMVNLHCYILEQLQKQTNFVPNTKQFESYNDVKTIDSLLYTWAYLQTAQHTFRASKSRKKYPIEFDGFEGGFTANEYIKYVLTSEKQPIVEEVLPAEDF